MTIGSSALVKWLPDKLTRGSSALVKWFPDKSGLTSSVLQLTSSVLQLTPSVSRGGVVVGGERAHSCVFVSGMGGAVGGGFAL